MTLSRPPPGGATLISGSTPAGGQITPFESASLSLRFVVELGPLAAGGGCAPGGQAAPDCAGGPTVVWAVAATGNPALTSSAMQIARRKAILPTVELADENAGSGTKVPVTASLRAAGS